MAARKAEQQSLITQTGQPEVMVVATNGEVRATSTSAGKMQMVLIRRRSLTGIIITTITTIIIIIIISPKHLDPNLINRKGAANPPLWRVVVNVGSLPLSQTNWELHQARLPLRVDDHPSRHLFYLSLMRNE